LRFAHVLLILHQWTASFLPRPGAMSDPKRTKVPPEHDEGKAIARRKLLLQARYVPPAILATLFVDLKSAAAASCAPAVCTPGGNCGPTVHCHPAKG
jgi:hypothetical protein